jgi:hypothetical protein
MKLSFSQLLGLTFIILKLCQVINWSWWLVLLPLYIGWAFILAFGLAFIFLGVSLLFLAGIVQIIDYVFYGR